MDNMFKQLPHKILQKTQGWSSIMQNENVIQILDKVSKLLQLGNIPAAKREIEGTLEILQRDLNKKNGKIFQEIHIPQMTETEFKNPLLQRDFEISQKVNEIIFFLNHRFAQ